MKPPTIKQIKSLRAKTGLPQTKLASAINEEFTDISHRTIECYENGLRPIPRYYVYFLKIIADRC